MVVCFITFQFITIYREKIHFFCVQNGFSNRIYSEFKKPLLPGAVFNILLGVIVMSKKTITVKGKKLNTKPRPRVIETLLFYSHANNFDSAKKEWGYVTIVLKEDDAFVKHCELCGARNYDFNVMIQNENTNKDLKVGSECIKRFVLLDGCKNAEDAAVLIQQKVVEASVERELITLYKILRKAPKPSAAEVTRFNKRLSEYLNKTGKRRSIYTKEELQEILETVLDVHDYTQQDVMVLDCMIENPRKFMRDKRFRVTT